MTTTAIAKEVLLKAANKIETGGLCRGAYARDAYDNIVDPSAQRACSWDVVGAILSAGFEVDGAHFKSEKLNNKEVIELDVIIECYRLVREKVCSQYTEWNFGISVWGQSKEMIEVVSILRDLANV